MSDEKKLELFCELTRAAAIIRAELFGYEPYDVITEIANSDEFEKVLELTHAAPYSSNDIIGLRKNVDVHGVTFFTTDYTRGLS